MQRLITISKENSPRLVFLGLADLRITKAKVGNTPCFEKGTYFRIC